MQWYYIILGYVSYSDLLLQFYRIFLLFNKVCSNITVLAELCCSNLACCIFLILMAPCTIDGALSHSSKRLILWQKSSNILVFVCLTQKYCLDTVTWCLWQHVCMKIEVTMNQGETHCSNQILSCYMYHELSTS